MSSKTINVCDGCGKILEKTSESYYMNLRTDRFWNSVEMDWFEHNLEFCERCALHIKDTLDKIYNKLTLE